MRTTVLPPRLLDVIKRNRFVYRSARRARTAVGSMRGAREVPGLATRVHANDFMLTSTSKEDVESYEWGARNVVGCIERSLAAAGRDFDGVRSWLDFGAGYGRVIRFLLERVDPGRVHATDVIPEATEFCATEFGVWALTSRQQIADLRLGDDFDFVYAISVLTHLDEEGGLAFLRLMGNLLRPGGIVMFTAQGTACLDDVVARFGPRYRDRVDGIHRSFEETGRAYTPYGYYEDDSYGLAWCSERYVRDTMEELHHGALELLFFEPAGLEPGSQDVYAFRRRAS